MESINLLLRVFLLHCQSGSKLLYYCLHTVNCLQLDISNGSTNCSLGGDGVPSYEDTCDITCNNGFALNGSATRTYLDDGTWSGTDDACVKGNDVALTGLTVVV